MDKFTFNDLKALTPSFSLFWAKGKWQANAPYESGYICFVHDEAIPALEALRDELRRRGPAKATKVPPSIVQLDLSALDL